MSTVKTTDLATGMRLTSGERVEAVHVFHTYAGVRDDFWRLVSLSSWTATGEVVDGEPVGKLATRTVRAHVDVKWKVK